MKTRTVVHIALNAKNKQKSILVEAAGRFIPFDGYFLTNFFKRWISRSVSEWINNDYNTEISLKQWKKRATKFYGAVRFQRVTLIGESE